jgi:predicted ferric reductase
MTTPASPSTVHVHPPSIAWVVVYLLLVTLPLLALLPSPRPDGLGLAWDLSMAFGFAGLAIMALQFGLTARFRRASAPFGIDIIYYFHRLMALVGLALLAAHWLILRVTAPAALGPLLPPGAPWYMSAGRIALLLFALIVVTSLWRKPLRIEYDRWRIMHALFAVAAVVLAVWHVASVRHYTASPWQQGVWGGYTVLWLGLLGYVRLYRPWHQLSRPYRVVSVEPAAGRSWTLTLEPDGHDGLRFQPGQFAWLTLRHSPFAAREHPFSFSGSAERAPKLEFTIRELGDFTSTIGYIRPGEVAYVDGPHGVFTTDRQPDADAYVFVAGGVGVAPIMSMLRTLADRGDRRPLLLVYGSNDEDDILFRNELEQLRERLDLRVEHVLAEAPSGWQGATGLITDDVLRRVLPRETRRAVYYLCGPEPMSDAVQHTLRDLGVPLRRIHSELFDMA